MLTMRVSVKNAGMRDAKRNLSHKLIEKNWVKKELRKLNFIKMQRKASSLYRLRTRRSTFTVFIK